MYNPSMISQPRSQLDDLGIQLLSTRADLFLIPRQVSCVTVALHFLNLLLRSYKVRLCCSIALIDFINIPSLSVQKLKHEFT